MQTNDQALIEGDQWRISGTALVPASSTYSVGFRTGPRAVRISGSQFQITGGATYSAEYILHENTSYTNGTDGLSTNMTNRNRNFKNKPKSPVLADLKLGVDPGVFLPINIIAFRKVAALNTNTFAIGDNPDLVLEPNTSYVLLLKNSDTASAEFFYTAYLKGE